MVVVVAVVVVAPARVVVGVVDGPGVVVAGHLNKKNIFLFLSPKAETSKKISLPCVVSN